MSTSQCCDELVVVQSYDLAEILHTKYEQVVMPFQVTDQ